MKKILSMVLGIAVLSILLIGCSPQKNDTISGTYEAGTTYGKTVYTFDEEKNVRMSYTSFSYTLLSQTGTYELSDDGTRITITLSGGGENGISLPDGMDSFGGTFSFSRDEDAIYIGTVRYEKAEDNGEGSVSAGTGSGGAEAENGEAAVIPSDLRLNLPDVYSVTYHVTESGGISLSYDQTMIQTEDGIYLEFGESGERYVFEKQDSGKYLMYQYDASSDKYVTPVLPEAMQEQINSGILTQDTVCVDSGVVQGYVRRITEYFDFYESVRGSSVFHDVEKVADAQCQHYTAEYEGISGNKTVELWIDPKNGLCMKAIYTFAPTVGINVIKTVECTSFLPEEVSLPKYK